MSGHESDSSSCYDSDDSDINFLPGYVMEVEKQHDDTSINLEQDSALATDLYSFQPNSNQETQIEFELKLKSRFDGNEQPNSW